MANIARQSISRKLTITVLLTSGGSLLLACLVFVAYDVVTLRRAMIRDAGTLARVIGINSAVALTFDDPAAASETLAALSGAQSVLRATIYDRDGKLFASYTAPGYTAPGLEWEEPARRPVGSEDARFRGRELDLSQGVFFDGMPIGSIQIRWDARELVTRTGSYAGIVLALFCMVTAVAALNSARLRKQIAKPLSQLVRSSERIAAGDLSARMAASTDDEIGVLAQTFNAMVLGLRDLVEAVRQSIGDVGDVSDSLRESGARMSADVQRQSKAVADTEESAEQVRTSSLEVNRTVEKLAASAQETSTSIHEMEMSIGEIASHMDRLNESIDTTSSAVDRVATNVDEVARGVDTLHTATEETRVRLDELSASVRTVEQNAVESHELSADTSREASKGVRAVNETITAMIDEYIYHHRPQLMRGFNHDWLFAGDSEEHKVTNCLSEQISERLWKELELKITPHQFRHAAAYIMLKADPGNYELVRRVLGHRNIETTRNFYIGLETLEATRLFGEMVTGLERGEAPAKQFTKKTHA